jgi:hypothetical protein
MERRWLKIGAGVAGGVTTIIGLFALFSVLYNFQIIDLTGNIICEGTYENPCISEFEVRNPNAYVVDIYSKDQVKLDFSPEIYDYALFVPDGRCSATGSCACILKDDRKLGFEDWRCIDFTNKTKPRSDKVYNFRFPAYSTTKFRLVGIKEKPQDTIKWSFSTNDKELDPIWIGKKSNINNNAQITSHPLFNVSFSNGIFFIYDTEIDVVINYSNQVKHISNDSFSSQINFQTNLMQESIGRIRYNHTINPVEKSNIYDVRYIFPEECKSREHLVVCPKFYFNFSEAVILQDMNTSYLNQTLKITGNDLTFIDPVIQDTGSPDNPSGGGQPHIIRNSTGSLFVLYSKDPDTYVAISDDDGQTWRDSADTGLDCDFDGSEGEGQGAGTILIDSNNTLHIICFNDVNLDTRSVFSNDSGDSWSISVLISDEHNALTLSGAVGPDNELVVASCPDSDPSIFNSSNNGQSWSITDTTSGRMGECNIKIDSDGMYHLSGFSSGADDLFYANTTNPTSWGASTTVKNGNFLTNNGEMSMAINPNDNDIYIITQEDGDLDDISFFNSSDGVTWTETVVPFLANRVAPGEIVLGNDGTLHIIAQEGYTGNVTYSNSTDGGVTWSSATYLHNQSNAMFVAVRGGLLPTFDIIDGRIDYIYKNSTGEDIYYQSFVVPSYSDPTQVTECGNLTITNTNYYIQNDLISDGTCIYVKANNITLEGNGYNIDFSQGDNGVTLTSGINVAGVNDTLIRNLTINSSDVDGDSTLGIWSDSSVNPPNNGVWEEINITGTVIGLDVEGQNITLRNVYLSSITDSDMVVFDGVNITFENITSTGDLQTQKFSFTPAENVIVKNYHASGNNLVYANFGGDSADNITIIDSVLNGGLILDADSIFTLINSTYSSEEVNGGTLTRQWYLTTNVTDTSFSPINLANVNISNVSQTPILTGQTTGADGTTDKFTLISYVNNSGTTTNHYPYNITGWKTGYATNSTTESLTTNLITLLILEGTDTCAYSSGDWNIDASDNCVISSSVDVGGNDIFCTGNGSFTVNNNVYISNWAYRMFEDGCYYQSFGDGGFR